MTVLLLILLGVLALLVVGIAVVAVRLSRRVALLESEVAARHEAPPPVVMSEPEPVEFVITQVGEPESAAEVDAVPTVAPGLFADIVLRETVVQTASLFHGVRRALSPENRNRIRFEMRREVKRSRKQRRADLREARRDWEARQRAAMAAGEAAEGRVAGSRATESTAA
jgi:hypothetical protein